MAKRKCCITLSKLFLYGFKPSSQVENLYFALKCVRFFPANLEICMRAKTQNRGTILNGLTLTNIYCCKGYLNFCTDDFSSH